MKLVLGAYHVVGESVLRLALDRPELEDVALYTHKPAQPGVPDLEALGRELGVWVTTETVNEVRPPFAPDLVSLVYYRHIVGQEVIDMVDGRIFNLHPSLLPRHRGASSVPWAIIEGDSITGVTYHYVTPEVDRGDIILQIATQIEPAETQGSLYERLMMVGAATWESALLLVREGRAGLPQTGRSCRHPRGVPYEGVIDPGWPRPMVERFIRAMTYPPLPPATYRGGPVRTIEDFDRLHREP